MSTGKTALAGLCGVLNLNKPAGVTSRAVVDRVSRPLRRVKVGHAGTLDPLASGVLVVAVGAATRLIEYVQRMPKTYRTVVLLGARSDTHDADGHVVEAEVAAGAVPTLEEVREAVATQVGTILQKPPEFSALKVEGKRAYDLARAGQAVDLAPRSVTIHRVDLLEYSWPRLSLEVFCEGGTYIRSIARDLGELLGCGGLVAGLTRTAIGPFTIEQALDPSGLSAETIPSLIRPAADAVAMLPTLRLTEAQAAYVALGRAFAIAIEPGGLEVPKGEVALLGPDGLLAAVGEADPTSGWVAPKRVLTAL
jgi:tRNA pseudouridine55 synthase